MAEVSGARVRQIFLRILLPLLLPVLLAAWIYVFVLAVRELGASVFLVGPGTHVLGTISLTMWEEGGSYGAVSRARRHPDHPADRHRGRPALAGTARAAARGQQPPPRRARRSGMRGQPCSPSKICARPSSRPAMSTVNAVDGISLGIETGKLHHAARALRLRQDHDVALPRRAGAAGSRADRHRRPGRVRFRARASSCRRATAASAWCSSPTRSGRT